ncbi:MAG TPA: LacI family DNA-binding transcriptional regulator [Actinophytocola sp.]|uniref:LacI family DNA-binding transcriptional regulator n=1 Tax=Actinophytocola sp. TaxID=1872138 RepID=UPI002DBD1E5C|nr:LacI family DNA-binding transcriptional regulator [Actinophytocola sp.]HEU5472221.1 LacI family DNA-binding transcriptional regulator [Actinophytocola sp.]
MTISDVAALAGVSVGTVSKALNGRGSLRPETRDRVREAAERLGFQANAAARSLNTGRTYTVGMITTDTIGRFSIPLMIGAEDSLGAGQMSVFLCDGRDDPIREQYYLDTLLRRRVDGIIVTGRRARSRPPIRAGLPVPVVYAFVSSTDPRDCSLVPDEGGGAAKAIEHLLAVGRSRIVHVTGPEHHHSTQVRAAAAAAAVDLAAPPMFGEWSESWGRHAIGMLLATGAEFDAVFCGSDQIARGCADALRLAGRRVPDDVALVGFDNWDVMALACQPPLSSVDLELQALGRAAADRLLAAINGSPAPGLHTHPCRLIVRESSAAPLPG